MADDDGPKDQFTEMNQGAAASHECCLSLRVAGFSEYQALYITAQVIIGSRQR